ncbi:hypothetical protein ABZX90_16965 [Streptomyces sp. NPDC002935]|uniref:hypothetical protein n=1 Tax=unclassified Streptomyces TaxID=2593676 RepID=UPI00331A5B68
MGEGIDHAANLVAAVTHDGVLLLWTAGRTSGAAARLDGGNRFRRRFDTVPAVENRWVQS